jgi:hypothetical protein
MSLKLTCGPAGDTRYDPVPGPHAQVPATRDTLSLMSSQSSTVTIALVVRQAECVSATRTIAVNGATSHKTRRKLDDQPSPGPRHREQRSSCKNGYPRDVIGIRQAIGHPAVEFVQRLRDSSTLPTLLERTQMRAPVLV